MSAASDTIDAVRTLMAGEPVYLAGSLVAEHAHGKSNAHTDVDLFCSSPQILVAMGQKLIDNGFTFGPRFDRTWARWMRYGFKSWHTNSLKLLSPQGHGLAEGTEFNLIYKTTEGHAATSLAQVIESFDFGLLAVGWDLETDRYRDMRSYLFPGLDPDGPLPMMPNKCENWRNGFISQYNGLRECGRYAKYHRYTYDMSVVKEDLLLGYNMAIMYLSGHFEKDKQAVGVIYQAIADHIEADHIDELIKFSETINYKDELDIIMEAIE